MARPVLLIVRSMICAPREKGSARNTILLIEQNIALALEAAERAYVIEGGLIHYSGTSSELADSPRVLSTYLGVEEAIAG